MINFLSSWVKNLALALIVVSILEMILPNNKTKKYIKMIMGLYILFNIISPFVENSNTLNIDNFDFYTYVEDVADTSSESEQMDQSSMDSRLNQIYEEELEKDIIQKLEQKNYKIESCHVVAKIFQENSQIEKITLKISEKIEDNKKQDTDTIENKIVTEIQKIQKIEINSAKNQENNENNDNFKNEEIENNTNITKTDIKIIKGFLISEYGVNEECLKIN